MEYKREISPRVETDIMEICSYISEDNPAVALKVYNRIYDAIYSVTTFPTIGVNVSARYNIESRHKYFTVLPYPYLIFYEIVGDTIYVDAVIHGKRNLNKLLKKLGKK